MPLAAYVAEQMAMLEAFMAAPRSVVRVLLIGPELRDIIQRMLTWRGDQPDCPHRILVFGAPFADPVSWFEAMRAALDAAVPNVPHEAEPATRPGPWAFLLRAEAVAEAMSGQGAQVVLIVSSEIAMREDYLRSIAFLVERVRSRRLKFVVFDDRTQPILATPTPGQARLTSQTCWCPPEQLRRRAAAAAAAPEATASDAALAGSLALAMGDAAGAEAAQRVALRRAAEAASRVDEASAAASLGATLVAEGKMQEAVEVYVRGCDVCSQHELTGLAPLLCKGLGLALHRLGEKEQAYSAFKTARGFLHADGNVIGEAHLCDALATLLAQDGRPEEAVRIWRYVRGLYERLDHPALAQARANGSAEVDAKLRQHGA